LQPRNPSDWLSVARDREMDTMAIVNAGHGPSGAIYMAGYIIECSLKAYLNAQKRRIPQIHEIRELWRRTGLRFADLPLDKTGKVHYFLFDWRVDLRYEVEFRCDYAVDELVATAKWLSGRIQTWARRSGRR